MDILHILKRINLKQKFLTFLKELVVFLLITSPVFFYLLCAIFNLSQGVLFHILLFCLIFLSTLSIYGAFIEPYFLVVRNRELDIEGLSKKFRIVFFTDLHVGPYKRSDFVKRVVKKVNSLRADLIFIGGDFTTGEDFHPKYLTPLKKLEANYPIVAVLGNHDYNLNFSFETPRPSLAKKVAEKLKSLNIKVLRNKSYTYEFGKEKVNIVGIDSLWAKKDNVEKAFRKVEQRYPTVVLAHNPDIVYKVKKLEGKRVDILLSGHTHGNQFRLPFDGALFPFIRPIKLSAKYLQGFNKFRGIPMYVNAGTGETLTRIRLFDPPEIVVFDLK